MNQYQILNALEGQIRQVAESMLRNQQINAAQLNFILAEWNQARNNISMQIMTKYPNGDMTLEQANASAIKFIDTAMRKLATPYNGGMGMMNNGMMYNGANPMYNGAGMMYQQDLTGGMYGNAGMRPNGYNQSQFMPADPQASTCPYTAALNVDAPDKQPEPQPTAQSIINTTFQEQPKPAVTVEQPTIYTTDPETARMFEVKMVTMEPEIKEDDLAREVHSKAKTTDVGDVDIVSRTTNTVYKNDMEALVLESRMNPKGINADIYSLSYKRSEGLRVPRAHFLEFQSYLENNVDTDACRNTKDHRGMIKQIINGFRSNMESVPMKYGHMLEGLLIRLVNNRANAGAFAPSQCSNYQIPVNTLDDLAVMDNPERGLQVLLAAIDEIKRYEVLDLRVQDDRDLVEELVPESCNLDELRDVTDEKVIEATIASIDMNLTFVIYPKTIYQFSKIPVPLIISKGTVNPIASPTFKGTPDSTFEHFIADMVGKDYHSHGPMRVYLQPTPNMVICFMAGVTTDNAIRLVPINC